MNRTDVERGRKKPVLHLFSYKREENEDGEIK